MPFRDREWEDFLRDCETFPAYTDYIFGIDTRPEVDDEPGLHPQIYDMQPQPLPQLPPQRLQGLPPPLQYPAAYDLGTAQQHALMSFPSTYDAPTSGWLGPEQTSMLRQESSLQSMQPTPTPAPGQVIISDPQYPQNSYPQAHVTARPSVLRQESSLESMQHSPTPAPRQLPASALQSQPHSHAMPGLPMLRYDSFMGALLQPTLSPSPRESPAAGLQPHTPTMPGPSRTPMLRQDSPMGAPQAQTQPSPRAQLLESTVHLIRPGEIIDNLFLPVVPQDRCMEINKLITQAWSIVNSNATPQQKAPAMDYIRKMSLAVAEKIDLYKAAAAELDTRLG